MQKPLALLAVVLIAFILATGLATGAIVRDEFTVPLDRYVNLSSNLTIHILQVTISSETYGGAYSPDPENSIWPVLLFQYENYGIQQVAGRLHMQFTDSAGEVYDKKDVYMGGPIYPGKKSPPQTLEIAIPKNRTLAGVIVIDEWTGKQVLIPVEYGSSSSTAFGSTQTPSPEIVVVVDDNLRNLLIIPIILVIVGLVGWYIAKTRLF
ncbi:MAG: hypothetical protein A4E28_02176 [Methanocella sp. PtaU1.Bin125]|nr:MAG: hypothetical protein A4E28_02176 [Methanocella sp. PtaU1.Bin125]